LPIAYCLARSSIVVFLSVCTKLERIKIFSVADLKYETESNAVTPFFTPFLTAKYDYYRKGMRAKTLIQQAF
jgi:hypothetical protein